MFFLLAAMVDEPSMRAETIREAEAIQERYAGLAELIKLQFPYRRAERRGTFTKEDACSNGMLLLTMANLDSDLAMLGGFNYRELRRWFDSDGDAMMPRVAPLFAKEPKSRKARTPAKETARADQ